MNNKITDTMDNINLTNNDISIIIHHANKWMNDAFGEDLEERVIDMIGSKIKTSQDAYDLNDFEDQSLQEITICERDAIDWGFYKLGKEF